MENAIKNMQREGAVWASFKQRSTLLMRRHSTQPLPSTARQTSTLNH